MRETQEWSVARDRRKTIGQRKMTLAITIASLSLAENTFDQMELYELSTNDDASVPERYHSMICDAATGKIYVVREAKVNASTPARGTRIAPSKVVYFEYKGRIAPYSHIVCQADHQLLSREERRRVCEAYRVLQDLNEEREAAGQRPAATRQYGRADCLVLVPCQAIISAAAAMPSPQIEGARAR